MWKENPDGTETPNQLFFTKADQKRRYAREKKERETAEMRERSDALYKVQQFLGSQGLPNAGKTLEQIEKEVLKDIRSKDPARQTIKRCQKAARERMRVEKEKKMIKTDNNILISKDYITIPEELDRQQPNYERKIRRWKLTSLIDAKKNNNIRINEFQNLPKPKNKLEILQEEVVEREELEKKAQEEELKANKLIKRNENLMTREYRRLKDEINKKVTEKMKDLFVGLYGYEPTRNQYWQFYRKSDSIKKTKKLYLNELLKEYGLDQEEKQDINQIDESKYTVDELWEIYNPPEIAYHGITSITSNSDELKELDLMSTDGVRKPRGRNRKNNIGVQVRIISDDQIPEEELKSYQGDRINDDGLLILDLKDPLLKKSNAREHEKRRISRRLDGTRGIKGARKRREVIKEKLRIQEHHQD